jgi:DNA-binding CsgD family transcriptional regulator
MAKQRPTRRQLEVLRAYIAAGSVAAAAHELGISETTARQHLSGLYRRTGCLNAAQAAYRLGAEGWAGGHPRGGPTAGAWPHDCRQADRVGRRRRGDVG